MVNGCIVFMKMTEFLFCFFPPNRLKSVCIPEQNTSQDYQTDLEVILEFLEEHCRQETRAQWQTGEDFFFK